MYTHNLDPVLIDFGFIVIRWYSLAYIFGITVGWWWGRKIINHIIKDIKNEISTDFKFKKNKILNKLELVSREEFEVLKKIVQKQDATIKKLIKNKKTKKAKRS